METANITLRKPLSKSSNDLSATWDLSNETDPFDTSSQSLPNTSINDNEQVKILQEQILTQTLELKSAHEEIEQISLENTELKRKISLHEKTINLFKKIGLPESSFHSITSPVVNKIKSSLNRTPAKSNPSSPNKNVIQIIHLEKKIKLLENQLQDANNEIKKLVLKLENMHNNLQQNSDLSTKPIDILISTEQTGSTPATANRDSHINMKRKIIILADQLGRGVRSRLQDLVGEEYLVTSVWKPGAKLCDILSSGQKELMQLTNKDFVILLGGVNERNPFEFKCTSETWVQSLKNTNVLICEIPFNQYLNEKKLNYDFRYICNRHSNSIFVDMDFSQFLPHKSHFSTHISRHLLKEILRIDYQNKIIFFKSQIKYRVSCNKLTNVSDKYTQTENLSYETSSCNCNTENITSQNPDPNSNELFRV